MIGRDIRKDAGWKDCYLVRTEEERISQVKFRGGRSC